jgi:hypothetical protein
MDDLSNAVYELVEKHLEIGDPPWVWCTYVKELLKIQNVEAAIEEARKDHGWKNSTPCLTAFVRDQASQLFAMLVYVGKIKLIDRFCGKGMGDVMFPVKLLEDNQSIESTKGDPPIKLEFGSQLRFKDATDLFAIYQWRFFVPELRWRPFECPAFDPGCKLPFLGLLDEINRTEFSIVYRAVVHSDYISVQSNGLVSIQANTFTFCRPTSGLSVHGFKASNLIRATDNLLGTCDQIDQWGETSMCGCQASATHRVEEGRFRIFHRS